MLMFAPLGFLLPLLSKKCERFSIISSISFITTVSIELIQLMTGKGIFELDDLLHNFIGSIFGYFVIMFLLDIIRNKKVKMKSTIKMLLIPTFYALLFLVILIVYHNQKYGNLGIIPAKKQNMSVITIENSIDLNDETRNVSTYHNKYTNDFNRAKEFSKIIENIENIKFNKNIRTERNNKIFVTDEKYQLTYFMNTGTWSYTNWKEYGELSKEDLENSKTKIEEYLNNYNLLPKNAVCSIQNNNMIRWDLQNEDYSNKKSNFESGLIMVQFFAKNEIANLDYNIIYNEYVGQEEIISVKEAYKDILKGNFEQYIPFNKGDTLYIKNYALNYIYDSKGYYRPVYQFEGYINNEDNFWECQISALR